MLRDLADLVEVRGHDALAHAIIPRYYACNSLHINYNYP
jgi:hypothetical protein